MPSEIQKKILNEIGKNAHKLKRCIEVVNRETQEIFHFSSKNQAANFCNLTASRIYLILAGKVKKNLNYEFRYLDKINPEFDMNASSEHLGAIYIPYIEQKERKKQYNKLYYWKKIKKANLKAKLKADLLTEKKEILESELILNS